MKGQEGKYKKLLKKDVFNKNKLLKVVISIVIVLAINIIFSPKQSLADVGSFEDYSSGSDWGSSSWDSSDWSSGSSSDWSSSSSSSSHRGSSGSFIFIGDGGSWIYILIIIVVILLKIYIERELKSNMHHKPSKLDAVKYAPYNERAVESKIKLVDPNFNKEEFEGFAKEVFIKLQNAWTERDWEKIRPFESEELFAQHKAQLDGYIKNNQINVMDRISVNGMFLVSFEQSGEKDVLKVDLKTRMNDYIIDATTKKVIKGDKYTEYYHTYTLSFIRKSGIVTSNKTVGLNTTNCPNCGAPTTITSSGRCEYCNSVITTEDHGWVLSNLTRRY